MASPAMPVSSSTMLDGSGVVVVRLKLTVPREVLTGKVGGTVSTNRSPVKLVPGARDSGKLLKKPLSFRVTGAVTLKLSPFKNTAAPLLAGADTVAPYVR